MAIAGTGSACGMSPKWVAMGGTTSSIEGYSPYRSVCYPHRISLFDMLGLYVDNKLSKAQCALEEQRVPYDL